MHKNKEVVKNQIKRSQALHKVRKTIRSCDTIGQLKSSYKMIDLFNDIYQNDILTFKLAEAWDEKLSDLREH
jgi:hypothetical protein